MNAVQTMAWNLTALCIYIRTKIPFLNRCMLNTLGPRKCASCPRQVGRILSCDATGLVRALSARDMFVWTIVFFPWFSSWISNFWYTPGVVWNVNYYLSLGIWFVLFCVIPPAVWWMMTCIMPKTGGDYVFASRGLHPALGFAASFSVTFALALTAIAGGPLYGLAEAAGQLETAGQIAGNPGITAAGFFIDPFGGGSKVVIFTIGIIVLLAGAAFAFFGTGIYNKVMWTVFIIGLVGLVIELPIMLTTSKASFTAAYAQYFPGGVPVCLLLHRKLDTYLGGRLPPPLLQFRYY